MQIYNVDFKRMALLLLPTVLRKPIVFAMLKSACKAFDSLQAGLFNFQNRCNVRMNHTPQVCYLKGILNDSFGIQANETRFVIVDSNHITGVWLITYEEGETYTNVIPVVEEYTMVYTESAINEEVEDFVVKYPDGIGIEPDNDKYRQMVALVNQYRLASKTAKYVVQE
ncbi:MAG: hypothetical protein J6Y55_11020 [Bacteroidales bacterium]|nr:hypothetical protein [Bacteroidales bacterium]